MTSFAPALSAACLAPSLIWLKNKACWLIVTSATVAAFAAVIPSMAPASATTPKPFIIDLIVRSIRLFWTPNYLAIETDATGKLLDHWNRALFSAYGARLRGALHTHCRPADVILAGRPRKPGPSLPEALRLLRSNGFFSGAGP